MGQQPEIWSGQGQLCLPKIQLQVFLSRLSWEKSFFLPTLNLKDLNSSNIFIVTEN